MGSVGAAGVGPAMPSPSPAGFPVGKGRALRNE
jgi:hypothetical protein